MSEPTIQELMQLDPLQCSDQDLDRIVEEFRSKRHLYNSGVAPSRKSAKPKLSLDIGGLKL